MIKATGTARHSGRMGLQRSDAIRWAALACLLVLLAATVAVLVSDDAGDAVVAEPTASPSAGAPTSPEPTTTAPTTPDDTAASPAASPEPASTSPVATPTPTSTPSPSPSSTEVRAVWVHLFDDTLKTPASIDRMVDRVADANANTLVVEVVRRQDAYYDSDVLPRTTDPDVPAGFDVLAHVLDRAHARGLAVHAWVPILTAHHHVYDDLPTPPGWVWTEHGPDAPPSDRWVTRTADGAWSDHLDPGLPAVRQHVAAVMAEIAARYPVDGVHLDYVRYTDRDTGYHPAALERFRGETGATGTPSPDDAGWSAWRRDQVTTLVQQVRAAVRAADPDVALTAAVIAQSDGPTTSRPFAATRGYADYFQDWVGWAQDGLVEAVFPMAYFDQRVNGGPFGQWADFSAWFAGEVDTLVVGGQAGYLNTPAASLAQLERLAAGTDGVSLYSFQQTAESEPFGVLFDRLPQGLWSEPAAVPDVLRR